VEGELIIPLGSIYPSPVFVCKVVVERWRQASPTDFWAEFSTADGKHLTFAAITERLRAARKEDDKRVCENAKAEYGASFTETFSYRKGGVTKVMTDPAVIAKHWRALQNN
jgi:hypothetical protein